MMETCDVLEQHCFSSPSRGRHFDEWGNEAPGAVEPVRDRDLHGYRTIDDEISDALGFGRA